MSFTLLWLMGVFLAVWLLRVLDSMGFEPRRRWLLLIVWPLAVISAGAVLAARGQSQREDLLP